MSLTLLFVVLCPMLMCVADGRVCVVVVCCGCCGVGIASVVNCVDVGGGVAAVVGYGVVVGFAIVVGVVAVGVGVVVVDVDCVDGCDVVRVSGRIVVDICVLCMSITGCVVCVPWLVVMLSMSAMLLVCVWCCCCCGYCCRYCCVMLYCRCRC